MPTIAMIGLTHPHSRMYLDTLDVVDEVAAIVLCDEDEDVAREVAGRTRKVVASYGDADRALAHPGVTHALIAVPNDRAVPLITAAIERGLGVFTEKPGARTAAEFQPVIAALERRPAPFTMAYLNRWQPTLRQMRELFQQGAIGELRAVELRMVTTQVRLRDPSHWLFNGEIAGGGILTWLACHWLDWVRYATGQEYARVSAELATLSGEAISVEDTAAVTFRLAGGAVGSLHAGYLLSAGNPGYEGTSSDWAIHLRGSHGSLGYHRGTQGDEPLILESSAPGWRNASPRAYHLTTPRERGYGGLAGNDFFRAFLAAGAHDPTPHPLERVPGALDALHILELLDAIHEASREGRTVELA
jgi:predicted dehydrogenase